ncbi:MGH1-like glycoside hydrolase domain-containing protein [Leptolyngbya sp. FACHB-261]|uniref:MGH1-like glycoside hydrolase domain-containing protein n=1 Tax=Leptolyngbya sp. FACHB-261 TaxID=2692806 RepID=UPI0016890D87|nr:hypothetical protein [Leptolyngbya sp. FACHB-261]MBD2103474.1 hypothetical protein [Leptolyngbya sp. FACHB-261]
MRFSRQLLAEIVRQGFDSVDRGIFLVFHRESELTYIAISPDRILYPYEWNHDTALVVKYQADVIRALAERNYPVPRSFLLSRLRVLCQIFETHMWAMHSDGMLPHIVFFQDLPDEWVTYFPGPDYWHPAQSRIGIRTSSINQPPHHGETLCALDRAHRALHDGERTLAFSQWLNQRLLEVVQALGYFHRAPGKRYNGLFVQTHPWANGWDNSPPVLRLLEERITPDLWDETAEEQRKDVTVLRTEEGGYNVLAGRANPRVRPEPPFYNQAMGIVRQMQRVDTLYNRARLGEVSREEVMSQLKAWPTFSLNSESITDNVWSYLSQRDHEGYLPETSWQLLQANLREFGYPIWVVDPQATGILQRSQRQALEIAKALHNLEMVDRLNQYVTETQKNAMHIWTRGDGHQPWLAFDWHQQNFLEGLTPQVLGPLYGQFITGLEAVDRLIDILDGPLFQHGEQICFESLILSADPADPLYDPLRYWRGPKGWVFQQQQLYQIVRDFIAQPPRGLEAWKLQRLKEAFESMRVDLLRVAQCYGAPENIFSLPGLEIPNTFYSAREYIPEDAPGLTRQGGCPAMDIDRRPSFLPQAVFNQLVAVECY